MTPVLSAQQRFDEFVRSDGFSTGNRFLAHPSLGLWGDALACMYDEDWVARRAVEIWPATALGQGFKIKGDDNGTLAAEWQRLNHTQFTPEGLFRKSRYQGRLYGGAALFPVTRSGDPAKPYRDGEEVIAFDTFRRDELYEVARETDKASPNFGQITVYEVKGSHARAGQQIDASRLILAPGMNRETKHVQFTDGPRWQWISCLLPIAQALKDYNCTWTSVSRLINEASIGVLKIKGLLQLLKSTNKAEVDNRLSALHRAIAQFGFIALDGGGGPNDNGEESFTRTDVRFAAVPDLLVQYCQAIAGAIDVPAAVFFGMSPAGLNATGEFDTRTFYNKVQTYRVQDLQPALERALSMVARKPVEIEWPPLWEPTAKEAEELRKSRLEGDRMIVDMGGASGAAITEARVKDGTLGVDISEEDAKDPLEGEPTDPEDPSASGDGAPAGADVQAQALNGAQTTSLLEILDRFYTKQIPRGAAIEAIRISFPSVSPESAAKMLEEGFTPEKPEPEPSPFGGGPPGGGPPVGPKKDPPVGGPPAPGNPPE